MSRTLSPCIAALERQPDAVQKTNATQFRGVDRPLGEVRRLRPARDETDRPRSGLRLDRLGAVIESRKGHRLRPRGAHGRS